MPGSIELFSFVIGTVAVGFATVRYVRERSRLRRIIQASEPIAKDGWMTEPNEPEYLDIYNEQQRGAFGSFGHLLLYGAGLIAAGMHIEFRHSVVQLLGLGS